MTNTCEKEDRQFKSALQGKGEIIGCLTKPNPATGMFDAVTDKGYSVKNFKKLPAGTEYRTWKGEVRTF